MIKVKEGKCDICETKTKVINAKFNNHITGIIIQGKINNVKEPKICEKCYIELFDKGQLQGKDKTWHLKKYRYTKHPISW